jgi:ankyrin repeat protein
VAEVDLFDVVSSNDANAFKRAIGKVDINIVNESGENLLHEAVASGSTKLGLELIRRGINVNQQDSDGQTPLHYAGIHQTEELAKAILEAGGNPSIKDGWGNTPLWSAVINPKCSFDLVKLIVSYGPDPLSKNKAGASPMSLAKEMKSKRLIAILEGREK